MAIRQRERWLALDARGGSKGNYEEDVLPATGGLRRERPKAPQGVTLSGRPGYIDISWQPVTETESGKPLEALARYRVYYKWGSGDIPDIDPQDELTYDDFVVVDNTRVSFVARPGANPYIKVAVTCLDRWGRESDTSSQPQGTTIFRKTATVLDWGQITSYTNIEYTIVRQWPTLVVPDGYRYVVTVWPKQGFTDAGAYSDSDLFDICFTNTYGLFWYDGQGSESYPHLLPGTYTNVRLAIMHFQDRESEATCWDSEGNSVVPHYSFDYTFRGLLRLGNYIVEMEVPSPSPRFDSKKVFVPVIWMLWSVPI